MDTALQRILLIQTYTHRHNHASVCARVVRPHASIMTLARACTCKHSSHRILHLQGGKGRQHQLDWLCLLAFACHSTPCWMDNNWGVFVPSTSHTRSFRESRLAQHFQFVLVTYYHECNANFEPKNIFRERPKKICNYRLQLVSIRPSCPQHSAAAPFLPTASRSTRRTQETLFGTPARRM